MLAHQDATGESTSAPCPGELWGVELDRQSSASLESSWESFISSAIAASHPLMAAGQALKNNLPYNAALGLWTRREKDTQYSHGDIFRNPMELVKINFAYRDLWEQNASVLVQEADEYVVLVYIIIIFWTNVSFSKYRAQSDHIDIAHMNAQAHTGVVNTYTPRT